MKYQGRVIVEQKELEDKIEKLNNFIHTDFFETQVIEQEQKLLIEQLIHMKRYNSVLEERIKLYGEYKG